MGFIAAQALLRGDFVEEDTIRVSAPGGGQAEGLVLSQGGSANGAARRGKSLGLTDADLLGVSADGSYDGSHDAEL